MLVAVAVYATVSAKSDPRSSYTATAAIRQPAESPAKPLSMGLGSPRPDVAAIRDEILSEANLAEALHQLQAAEGEAAGSESAPSHPEAIARVRESLRVSVADPSSPGQSAIAITCTDRGADRAVRLANVLASQYVQRHGAARKAEAERSCAEARNQAQRAREVYLEARREFERFLDEHFREHQARADLGERPPAGRDEQSPSAPQRVPDGAPSPSVSDSAGGPVLVGDPEWLGLDKQQADLEQRRARLLVDRTPLHPEVQDLDAQIAEVRRRLDEQSRTTPQKQAAAPRTASPGRTGPGERPVAIPPVEQLQVEAARAFLARRDTMLHAEQTLDQLAERERHAWQEQFAVPNTELQRAERSGTVRAVNRDAPLLLTALLAGAIAAAGVGIAFRGPDTGDLPFQTLSQAEAGLPVPIVGVIPASGSVEAGDRSSFFLNRLVTFLCGVVLVGSCLGMLVVLMNSP